MPGRAATISEIAVVQARGLAVEALVAGGDARDAIAALGRGADLLEGGAQHLRRGAAALEDSRVRASS
jgi:hypothetical protein